MGKQKTRLLSLIECYPSAAVWSCLIDWRDITAFKKETLAANKANKQNTKQTNSKPTK